MRLFLTHVDTPFRMYRESRVFTDTALMLSSRDINAYDEVYAVCAFWCDHRLNDEEGWHDVRAIRVDAKSKLQASALYHTYALEDARVLGDSPLIRLRELYDDGIRIITPMWRGVNRLGGAYDTDVGLTPYGRAVASAAMEMGILLDISHASDKAADEILHLARTYRVPVCATHSNFRFITPHPRNLTDRIAWNIAESGGIIGLNLVPCHIGGGQDLTALFRMYEHGCHIGVGSALALGTDLDGTDTLISPLTCAKDILLFAAHMRTQGCTDSEVDDLFFHHAATLFSRHFPCLFP